MMMMLTVVGPGILMAVVSVVAVVVEVAERKVGFGWTGEPEQH